MRISSPKLKWIFFFALLFLLFYAVVEKIRCRKQQEVYAKTGMIASMMLSLSVSFIFVMTVFGRTEGDSGFRIVPFASYSMALEGKDVELLLQILVNIAMYIPVGLLLPCCFQLFKKSRYAVLAAFLGSTGIELWQGLSKTGLFETDDILNNVLGALIGVGLYKMAGLVKQRIKKVGIFYLFLTLIWVGVIFSFSLQPASTSSEVSTGFGRWLVGTFLPGFVDRLETMPKERLEFLHFLLRKCGHFSEYFILGILSGMTVLQMKLPYRKAVSIGFCILAASVDETIQLFVSGRSGQVSDVILDSVGAIMGIVAVRMVCGILERRKISKEVEINKKI